MVPVLGSEQELKKPKGQLSSPFQLSFRDLSLFPSLPNAHDLPDQTERLRSSQRLEGTDKHLGPGAHHSGLPGQLGQLSPTPVRTPLSGPHEGVCRGLLA